MTWSAPRIRPEEAGKLEKIVADLDTFANTSVVTTDELDAYISALKSSEAKAYVTSLVSGSKPEVALREAFLSGDSLLGKVLAPGLSPEVFVGSGFVDYQLNLGGRKVHLELKPLLETKIRVTGARRELEGLAQVPFRWRDHEDQVLKYVRAGGRYVILTNLKSWLFFDDSIRPASVLPFHEGTTREIVRDLTILPDLYEQLDRYAQESVKHELDEVFYGSLRSWVGRLQKVQFIGEESDKLEFIIGLLNRFIFVQTLDDYRVIEFRWLRNAWDHSTKRWGAKGDRFVLKDFLTQVNSWFNEYYDTELFRDDPIARIGPSDEAAGEFLKALSDVLGFHAWDSAIIGYKGITQYNFKFIDRDIFGKAYETFLAEVRAEEGIFYTPAQVTEYIVRDTLGAELDDIVAQIQRSLHTGEWDSLSRSLLRLTTIKVLDPACGSGSFLTRVLRLVYKKYVEAANLLLSKQSELDSFERGLKRPPETESQLGELARGLDLLVSGDDRLRLAHILLRHIFGNDKDPKALEIAKVNLWLEAIRSAPESFRFDRLPKGVNHVLPDLRSNLTCGDALTSPPTASVLADLATGSGVTIRELQELRSKLLQHPTDPDIVEAIVRTREHERERLYATFVSDLKARAIPADAGAVSQPLFWPLEHWHVFFDADGRPLEDGGFDIILGNPPWVALTGPRAKSDRYVEATMPLFKSQFLVSKDQIVDTFALFLERSIELSRRDARIGNILPDILLLKNYPKLRTFLLDSCRIEGITHCGQVFPDASIDTIVLLLRATQRADDDNRVEVRFNLEAAIEQSSPAGVIDQGEFRGLPKSKFNIWLADPTRKELKERLETAGKRLDTYLEAHEGIHSGNVRSKLFIDRPSNAHCKKLIFGRNEIERYSLCWEGKYVDYNSAIIDVTKGEYAGLGKPAFFEKSKLLVRRTGDSIVAAYDADGFYVSNNMFVGLPKDGLNEDGLLALLGYLNSSLGTFYFRLIQPRVGRLFAELKIEHLHSLPVAEALLTDAKLVKLVREAIETRKLLRTYFRLWDTWHKNLSNDSLSLAKLLESDRETIRRAGDHPTVTRSVPFYPKSAEAVALPSVAGFDVRQRGEDGLSIVGRAKDGSVSWTYEIEFDKDSLRQHLFLAISTFLNRKTHPDTLTQLLDKVNIPVIKPNIGASTAAIVEKVFEEARRASARPDGKTGVTLLPLSLDTRMRELDAEIDAQVLRAYHLGVDQISAILKGVDSTEEHRTRVGALIGL